MFFMGKLIDLTNEKFGKLTALSWVKKVNATGAYWLCKCDCGDTKVICGNSLRKGLTKSCGCIMRQTRKTHGMSKTRVYNIWEGVKARCLNPNKKEWKNYGGRGIKLHKPWYNFTEFYKDMGDPPDNHVIDRADNDGDYTPENCKWVTYKESNNNTRHNINLTIKNTTKTITQWCEYYGVNPSTAFVRIFRGWDEMEAVSTVVQKKPS